MNRNGGWYTKTISINVIPYDNKSLFFNQSITKRNAENSTICKKKSINKKIMGYGYFQQFDLQCM